VFLGLEYIEEGCNDTGTAASFYCKLCDCHFTDPHAKLMHTKGRRHRQNYKVYLFYMHDVGVENVNVGLIWCTRLIWPNALPDTANDSHGCQRESDLVSLG